MTKSELQGIAAHRLAKERRLICQWATGCGKSGVVLRFLQDNPGMSCLILVPEQVNIQNWRDEFAKFGVPDGNVEVVCYASFHKHKRTGWDLLVFDEMPHVDTDKRLAICRSVSGGYILALGAVIDDDERTALETVYGKFGKSVIGIAHAMAMGILPSPVINVMHMDMNDSDRVNRLNGRMVTDKELYDHIQRNVDNAVSAYNANPTRFNHNRMLRAGNERKRLLGRMKDDSVRYICSKLERDGKRFICFCSSVKQAECLGGEKSFTSKTPASENVLQRFNEGYINSIYVVGKLIEGQNLNNIECGVITQLGGTRRVTVQEIGRVMRSDKPVIYIPVFDNTKDVSFLYTLTSSIPEECIKHYKVSYKNKY